MIYGDKQSWCLDCAAKRYGQFRVDIVLAGNPPDEVEVECVNMGDTGGHFPCENPFDSAFIERVRKIAPERITTVRVRNHHTDYANNFLQLSHEQHPCAGCGKEG